MATTISVPHPRGASRPPRARNPSAGCVLTSPELAAALYQLERLARDKNAADRELDHSYARLRARAAALIAVVVSITAALATVPTGTDTYHALISADPVPGLGVMAVCGAGLLGFAALAGFLLYLAAGGLWDASLMAPVRNLLTSRYRETRARAHAELDHTIRAVLDDRVFTRLAHHAANVSPTTGGTLREHLIAGDLAAITRTARDLHLTAPPCRVC